MYTLSGHPRIFQPGGIKGLVKRCCRVGRKFLPDMRTAAGSAKAKGLRRGCGLLVKVCAIDKGRRQGRGNCLVLIWWGNGAGWGDGAGMANKTGAAGQGAGITGAMRTNTLFRKYLLKYLEMIVRLYYIALN